MHRWRFNIADYLVLFLLIRAASPTAGFIYHSHEGGELAHQHQRTSGHLSDQNARSLSAQPDFHLHNSLEEFASAAFILSVLIFKHISRRRKEIASRLASRQRLRGSARAPPAQGGRFAPFSS